MSDNRECRAQEAPLVEAPELPYLPRDPASYFPNIGLIGCGGITPYHLAAYQKAGYNVVALCDLDRERAEQRRKDYYPGATVHVEYEDVLAREDIDVVDIATHPGERAAMIEAALVAGKHVLSQKPFVMDLDLGRCLTDLAEVQGLLLAVNQNGRWAPHFSYARHAVAAGLLGEVTAVHTGVCWDHNWTADTPFNKVKHLILYDFAVHWFDMVNCLMGNHDPIRVYASLARSPAQRAAPPLLAQVLVEYEGAQASLRFDADTRYGAMDSTCVIGTRGLLTSAGPDLNTQTVTLTTEAGRAVPVLRGDWFTNGFHGTMAELLCAIEEGREPYHSARDNLRTLSLCFAAIASAESHQPVVPGTVRTAPRD